MYNSSNEVFNFLEFEDYRKEKCIKKEKGFSDVCTCTKMQRSVYLKPKNDQKLSIIIIVTFTYLWRKFW